MSKRTEDQARSLLEENAPPEGAKIKNTDFVFEVQVENNPQLLKKLRPYGRAVAAIPGLLPDEAQIVLRMLFDCFEKAGTVSEGLIGDLMWGFQQCGVSPELTYNGLMSLESFGYIKFQAKDGAYTGKGSDKLESAWVRYQPKLMEMVYE